MVLKGKPTKFITLQSKPLTLGQQKEPEDYEQILSSLAVDIQKRQTRLSEIRLRERRTTLVFTVYTFALWAVYVGLWYAGWLPNFGRQSSWSPTAKGVPIVLGPIV